MNFDEVMKNIILITGYEDRGKMKYYFDKLTILVLDYTKRAELNPPLCTFIEDKLIQIATAENKHNETSGAINGIDLNSVKSITRGDTSITLKDGKISNNEIIKKSDYLTFSDTDYLILNRHRKVWREYER